MARPRKGAPRPDTQLVALRLPREVLARVDSHARRTRSTRSAALRDLLARGLSAAKSGKAAAEPSTAAACAWCEARPGKPHLEGCPHREDSALRAFILRARRKR